jgi:gamma-glutamyltranspeptidase/glutathione hydrolase
VNSGAVASESVAERAAGEILEEEGTVGEALIAGFLAASAMRPGVLWSPLQVLIAGPGTFARAFDGRARQPGLGLPRPRGVVDAVSVPAAAHVAAPASLGALALLHAYDATLSFQQLARPALDLAKSTGAIERRGMLTKVARLGPAALRAPAVLRSLLAVAGRTEGGLLSEKDLVEVRPESAPPREVLLGDRSALVMPWPAPEAPHRPVEVIVAADARGVLGVLGYAPDDEGVQVPELGVALTRDAVVVRRGIPRVSPGEVLPAPAPLAIALSGKLAFMALGVRSSRRSRLPIWRRSGRRAFSRGTNRWLPLTNGREVRSPWGCYGRPRVRRSKS